MSGSTRRRTPRTTPTGPTERPVRGPTVDRDGQEGLATPLARQLARPDADGTPASAGAPPPSRRSAGPRSPRAVRTLQRQAGNHATTRLLHADPAGMVSRDHAAPRLQRDDPDLGDEQGFVGPLSEEQTTDLQANARKLFTYVQAAYTDADAHAASWVAAASDFGSCYKDAFDTHESVRTEQERADQLAADLAFGVLTVVSGGVLGSMATIAKKSSYFSSMPEWKADGALEVLKGSAGKVVEGVAKPDVQSHDVATDPLTFYLDLKNALDHQVKATKSHLNDLVQRVEQYVAGDRPLHDLYYVDPEEVRRQLHAWKATQAIFDDAPTIPEAELKKELEIGMWAKWVPKLHTTSTQPVGCAGVRTRTSHSYSGPGRYVERRIKALAIPGFPSDIDWGTLWMSDDDVKKLIAWGQGWTPSKTFDLG